MSLKIKKRGRPRKNPLPQVKARRPDDEVMKELKDRFGMLDRLTEACLAQNIRALVVSGAPGVGKTYNVLNVLENTPLAQFEVVAGALSGVELFKLGYRNRHPGSVVVLDDADGIFTDEDALNVLKALCDSGQRRRVSWLKDSATLRQDEVPQWYDFHGAFIFITNINLQFHIDQGGNKYVPHFEALMSRSLYLDLRLHDRQAIALWVNHVATVGKMFAKEGVTGILEQRILAFLQRHRDDFRELSLRTAMKICQLAKTNPNDWENMSRILLCRT
jgi:hypothetical protein